ncbi:MAG TPA: hypothetical protein VF401_00365 [Candidatus Saccharimonadales bacterium]
MERAPTQTTGQSFEKWLADRDMSEVSGLKRLRQFIKYTSDQSGVITSSDAVVSTPFPAATKVSEVDQTFDRGASRGAEKITPESIARHCSRTPIGQFVVLEALEGVPTMKNPLRTYLAGQVIDLANAMDSLDHRLSPDNNGTGVQHDCQQLRDLARSFGRD